MTGTYLVQTTIPYFTGIPRDVVTNTMHFNWQGAGSPVSADYIALCQKIALWYNGIFPPAGSVAMASFVNVNGVNQKVYSLADPVPRIPVYNSGGIGIIVKQDTTTGIAPESAVCVSLKAASIAGVNPQSTRGRVYLGALGTGTVTAGTVSAFPAVSSLLRGAIASSCGTLYSTALTANWKWVIYSRTVGLSFPVVSGFVDNAIDTQRRRANAATTRSTFSIP